MSEVKILITPQKGGVPKIIKVAQKRLKRDFEGFAQRDSKVTTKETLAEMVTTEETPKRLKRDSKETLK